MYVITICYCRKDSGGGEARPQQLCWHLRDGGSGGARGGRGEYASSDFGRIERARLLLVLSDFQTLPCAIPASFFNLNTSCI